MSGDTAKSTYENEGRDWGDGKPKIASKPQEAKGEAWNSLPHSPQKEPTLVDTLCQTSSLQNQDNKFLLFKRVSVSDFYRSHSKLITVSFNITKSYTFS